MMVRWLLLIALLAAAALSAALLADLPGAVTLTVADYRITASVAVFVLALILFAAAAIILYQVLAWLRRAPRALERGQDRRRQRRGVEALTQGLLAVASGDGGAATRHAHRAERLLEGEPLTLLLSAQAAQLRGDDETATRLFTAMEQRAETRVPGLRGLLALAMKRQDWNQALALAERAYRLSPKSEWAVQTLYDMRKRAGMWADAEALLDRGVSAGLLPAPSAPHERADLLYHTSLDAETSEALRFAKKAVQADPAHVPAVIRLADLLTAQRKFSQAVAAIEEAWRRNPDPQLLGPYWQAAQATDALKKVQAAQQLARCNPDHPESRIAVAVAALEARLWGEARSSLESIAGDDAPPRVCRLMAQLEEAEHGDLQRAHNWLMRAAAGEGRAA